MGLFQSEALGKEWEDLLGHWAAFAGMMVKYAEYIWSADLKIAPSTMEPANSAEL